jgi:iron complex transport system ATP-binding protein
MTPPDSTTDTVLAVDSLKVTFGSREVIRNLSISLPRGRIHTIIGPNGSGKTTLLRAVSRNLKPAAGSVFLNGKSIHEMTPKAIARQMAVLSQVHNAMSDVSVSELVAYGRFAHREWWKGKSAEDSGIVDWALERTGITDFAHQKINTLSGGERQRAWIAMALAQKPQLLLLDEPTTFLDISHQLDVLDLISGLNKEEGITILMVLHDINHAIRFSDELVVLKDGELYARGLPDKILDPCLLREVFNIEGDLYADAVTGKPLFYPRRVVR